jgi:hypothetical protein
MSHYGGSFGSEAMQTSIPSCMNKMHFNYLWSSKVVPGSDVCNRASACTVLHRASSNVAKVDRTGQAWNPPSFSHVHFCLMDANNKLLACMHRIIWGLGRTLLDCNETNHDSAWALNGRWCHAVLQVWNPWS